jgi:hypothetical protein
MFSWLQASHMPCAQCDKGPLERGILFDFVVIFAVSRVNELVLHSQHNQLSKAITPNLRAIRDRAFFGSHCKLRLQSLARARLKAIGKHAKLNTTLKIL